MVSEQQLSMSKLLGTVESTKCVAGVGHEQVGDSLKNFLDVAMKMAQIDEAVRSARASAPPPEDKEAQKWHEVSIKALMWTRSSFAEQQSSALGELKGLVKQKRCASLPPKPVTAPISPSFALSAKATTFSPKMMPTCAKVPACPPGVLTPAVAGARVAAGEMGVGSLRDDLERLKEFDPKQCLIVRRIKRLGLGSPDILRNYFASFGVVAEVLIAHSFEKKSTKCRADRLRPAALGFVVMGSVQGAEAALQAGPTLMIRSVDVNVQIFESFDELQQRADTEQDASSPIANFQ